MLGACALIRPLSALFDTNIHIEHIPGKSNVIADLRDLNLICSI